MRFMLPLLITLVACAHQGTAPTSKTSSNAHLINATVWFQTSAENKALFYQGYHLAEKVLAEKLRAKGTKKKAVVLDLDETVLDNSPYQAMVILTGKSFPEGWGEWIEKANAMALPGSKEFLLFAEKKGVEIFYITNRKTAEREGTIRNLKKLGLPFKDSNLLVRTAESSKEARRQIVTKDYDLVLLLGDNLMDFADVFGGKGPDARNLEVDKFQADFGSRFIIFPNPMYGEWESALFFNSKNLSTEEKDALRKSYLTSF